MSYVELHCASNFSFLHGASHPEDLVTRAAALRHTALALTDRDGLYGIVRFDQAAREAGVRPIFGSEVGLDDGTRLVLLVRDHDGYRNLSRLLTLAHRGQPKGKAAASFDVVAEHARGLTVLSGWTSGSAPDAQAAQAHHRFLETSGIVLK